MMNYQEIEYKYRADSIRKEDFISLILSAFKLTNLKQAKGTDHFFTKGRNTIRFRQSSNGGRAEITIKKGRKVSNRTEVDVPLDPLNTYLSNIVMFMELLDYQYYFSIKKNSYIIHTNDAVFSYYEVDKKDAYIEVEARKDRFKTEEEGYEIINSGEKLLSRLGLTKQDRVKKSLFEVYREQTEHTAIA